MCPQGNRSPGATAYLHVRRPSGAVDYFIADDCEIADGVVTAAGRFKRPSGRLEPRRTYTWPRQQLVEIRWTRERVIA